MKREPDYVSLGIATMATACLLFVMMLAAFAY